jgi:hypothetical protein
MRSTDIEVCVVLILVTTSLIHTDHTFRSLTAAHRLLHLIQCHALRGLVRLLGHLVHISDRQPVRVACILVADRLSLLLGIEVRAIEFALCKRRSGEGVRLARSS